MKIAWLDVETGGLRPAEHALLSVAFVIGDAVLNIRIAAAPGLSCTDKALEINGLDPAVGMCEYDAAVAISQFLSAHQYDVVGGANVKFDIGFLNALQERTGVRLGLSHRGLDIQAVAMYLCDVGSISLPSYSLNSIAAYYGLARKGNTHGALEDAYLARDAYEHMKAG